MKVEVQSEALDTLKAMVETLQQERDELLEMAKKCRAEFAGLPRSLGYDFDYMRDLDFLIAKCTAKSEIMEKKQ